MLLVPAGRSHVLSFFVWLSESDQVVLSALSFPSTSSLLAIRALEFFFFTPADRLEDRQLGPVWKTMAALSMSSFAYTNTNTDTGPLVFGRIVLLEFTCRWFAFLWNRKETAMQCCPALATGAATLIPVDTDAILCNMWIPPPPPPIVQAWPYGSAVQVYTRSFFKLLGAHKTRNNILCSVVTEDRDHWIIIPRWVLLLLWSEQWSDRWRADHHRCCCHCFVWLATWPDKLQTLAFVCHHHPSSQGNRVSIFHNSPYRVTPTAVYGVKHPVLEPPVSVLCLHGVPADWGLTMGR